MMQIKADQGGTVPARVSLEGGSHDADKSRPGRYGACQGKFGGGVMMQIKGDQGGTMPARVSLEEGVMMQC